MKKSLLIMTMMIFCVLGVSQASAGSYNETANQFLVSAVKSDDLDQVRQAFDSGADPNYLQGRSDAPFYRAVKNSKSTEIVQCFIDNGVDVNFKAVGNGQYPSALVNALYARRVDVFEMLLNAGADPNLSFEEDGRDGDVKGVTVTFLTLRFNEFFALHALKLLIENGANVNKTDSFGNTPLIIGCTQGNLEGVKILLANGANPNQANYKSEKPLDLALKSENKELINLLIHR